MRQVIWGAAVSLDLSLAGPGDAIDWLRWSDEAAALVGECVVLRYRLAG